MRILLAVVLVSFSLCGFSKDKILSNFSVMTYNLENLFDTKHDVGKKDWTYLPLEEKRTNPQVLVYCNGLKNEHYKKSCLNLNWDQNILNQKMFNLSQVLKSYNNGQSADILIFQEVENKLVLKELFKKHFKKTGHNYFTLIEGPDSRGIDVAVVSRFPILKSTSHELSLKPYSTRSTRPILEVELMVRNKHVTVFANHWPSQGNKDETRMIAAETLKKLALKSKSEVVIAAGDFNTVSDDLLNGLTTHILPHFEDVEVKGRHFNPQNPEGTHWYKGEWESLDKIYVLKNSLTKGHVRVNYAAFEIIYNDFMLKDLYWTDYDTGEQHFSMNVPYRFDSKTGNGYSDHLPVAVEFDL